MLSKPDTIAQPERKSAKDTSNSHRPKKVVTSTNFIIQFHTSGDSASWMVALQPYVVQSSSISDSFINLGKIGQGSFGSVYKARLIPAMVQQSSRKQRQSATPICSRKHNI